MRSQTTTAEVIVPEQQTLSIMVTIASQVTKGLHALVEKHLSKTEPESRARTGDVITNTFSGTAYDTVIQIGKVHGQVNDNRGR